MISVWHFHFSSSSVSLILTFSFPFFSSSPWESKCGTTTLSENQLEDRSEDPIPIELILAFVIVMTLAVISHLGALLIASFMLPIMDVIYETGGEDMDLSPHTCMPLMVEISWILSNVVGILLFMMGPCVCL